MNEGSTVISTLCGKSSLDLIFKSFPTWFKFIEEEIIIKIYSDGSLRLDDQRKIKAKFDRIEFADSDAVSHQCSLVLKDLPACRKFRSFHLLCNKIFDIPINSKGKMLFLDTDIFLSKKISINKVFKESKQPLITMRDSHHCICPSDATLCRLYLRSFGRWGCVDSLNSGVIYLDTEGLDFEYIESLLRSPIFQYGLSQGKWVWEQTVWAFLAHRLGGSYLDSNNAIVVDHKNVEWEKMVKAPLVHFVGNARDKFLNDYLSKISKMQHGTINLSGEIFLEPFKDRIIKQEILGVIMQKLNLIKA